MTIDNEDIVAIALAVVIALESHTEEKKRKAEKAREASLSRAVQVRHRKDPKP